MIIYSTYDLGVDCVRMECSHLFSMLVSMYNLFNVIFLSYISDVLGVHASLVFNVWSVLEHN